MSLVIALGLLSIMLVALARPAPRHVVVRLVETERVDDRRRVSPAVPIKHRCGHALSEPTRDGSSW